MKSSMVVHLKTGRYYSLADSAAFLWFALQAHLEETTLARLLGQRYEIEPERATIVVSQFLQNLLSEQIVSPSPGVPEGQFVVEAGERLPFVDPVLSTHTDMEALLLLDPVHEVAEEGWPVAKN